jgi:hypothetical protein
MVEKLVRHQQDTCCFVGRLRTFGWRKVPLFPHSFRMHDLLNESTCWVDRREDPPTRKLLWSTWCPHYLSLIMMSWWWAQSPTATRCLLSRAHSLLLNEEIRCEVRKSKHEGEILMVQAKGFQPQWCRHFGGQNKLERLGCTISSCAHVENLLQNSNVEALMINWQQAPPWALADLVDSFPDERETFSNAFDMIEANLTSLVFGECKWYVDSGAENKLQ